MFDILNIACRNGSDIGNSDIDRDNNFYGQAVIDEDGYFEGLVTVTYSGIHIERFIFGSYKDKSITLYKFEPTNRGIRTRYDGYAFDDSFPGNFCVSVNDEPLVMGDISMDVLPIPDKELVEDISDIMDRINNWKHAFFDNDTNKLYEQLSLEIMREKDDRKVFEKK